jgi:aconitate hydratase
MSIYEAGMRYQAEQIKTVILAGADYGMGSSRDWAAKGTQLLGVKAVIAKSYERIHRSNLVMMGVLPLQFQSGQGWEELNITGHETFDILGLSNDVQPGQTLTVTATAGDGTITSFEVTVRLDSLVEVDYYRNGGILQTVLRHLM